MPAPAPLPAPPKVGYLVLAGGTSRRMPGVDKLDADLAGTSVLNSLLRGLPPGPVVVVGPRRHTPRAVTWAREVPAGSGPAAVIAAGLLVLPADVQLVVVLAGDQPFAGPVAPRLLSELTMHPEVDGVVGLDAIGRRQPLLAAYRRPALARAMAAVSPGDAARRALAGLVLTGVPVGEDGLDVDTPTDLAAARARIATRGAPSAGAAPGAGAEQRVIGGHRASGDNP